MRTSKAKFSSLLPFSLKKNEHESYNAVFVLILINLLFFVFDHVLKVSFIDHLYLNHSQPRIFQLVSAIFVHGSWAHLSSNLFFLYIFGKIIAEQSGTRGLLISYFFCGIVGNILSQVFLPSMSQGAPVLSGGASGALFGLFSVSVFIKFSMDWRRLLEVLILGQFFLERLLVEVGTTGKVDGVDHAAHWGGALAGIGLVVLSRILTPKGSAS